MAIGSQQAHVELMANLTGLAHDIFVGRVQNLVRRNSATAMQFQDAGPGEYRLEGQNMVFAVDLRFKTGSLATDGKIPDFVGMDAQQGKTTPIRRYSRIALDNLAEMRASGPGAFEDLGDRVFNHLWNSWECQDIRHAVGASSGLVAKVSSRTSSTVVVLKDGYGHTSTNPIQHLSEGSRVAWYDVNVGAIGGAAEISSINYSTNAITLDSATTWEPDSGVTVAADDLLYFSTTNNKSDAHFVSERNLAPNGVGTILDPDASLTTVFNISESTYPRWKPFRKSSVTFDHIEVEEHWRQLHSKRGFPVTPQTDVCVTFPSATAQLARSLMGFQQQSQLGGDLAGGYASIAISGKQIVDDPFFYHDVFATFAKDHLFRITLGGEADFWSEDGSMWSRIADHDGKDAFVGEYMNYMSNHRGANAALTGITTDVTESDFDAVPNY